MRNTFYDFKSVNEFLGQCKKLEGDLKQLIEGNCTEEDVLEYSIVLLKCARGYYGEKHDMLFWGYDEPWNMPSDTRVDLLYWPTYLVACFLAQAWMKYEKVRSFEPLFYTLHDALTACMGRNFLGHGYEAEQGFLEVMELFAISKIDVFVKEYSTVNAEFTNMFQEAYEYLFRQYGKIGAGDKANLYSVKAAKVISLYSSRQREA